MALFGASEQLEIMVKGDTQPVREEFERLDSLYTKFVKKIQGDIIKFKDDFKEGKTLIQTTYRAMSEASKKGMEASAGQFRDWFKTIFRKKDLDEMYVSPFPGILDRIKLTLRGQYLKLKTSLDMYALDIKDWGMKVQEKLAPVIHDLATGFTDSVKDAGKFLGKYMKENFGWFGKMLEGPWYLAKTAMWTFVYGAITGMGLAGKAIIGTAKLVLGIGHAIKGVYDWYQRTKIAAKEYADKLWEGTKSTVSFLSQITGVGLALKGLGKMSSIALKVTGIPLIMAGLGSIFDTLRGETSGFGIVIKSLWTAVEPIQNAFYNIAIQIAPRIAKMMYPAVQIAERFFNRIAYALARSAGASGKVATIMQGIEKVFTGLTNMVYTFLSTAGKVLLPIIGQLIDYLLPQFNDLIDTILGGFKYVNKEVVPIVKGMLEKIMPAVVDVLKAIVGGIKGAWKAFAEYMSPLFKNLKEYLGDGTDGKPGIISGIKNFLKGLASLVSALLPIMGKLAGWIMGVLLHPIVLGGLRTLLNFLADVTKYLAEEAIPAFMNFCEWVKTASQVVKEMFEVVYEWIAKRVEEIKSLLNWLEEKLGVFSKVVKEFKGISAVVAEKAPTLVSPGMIETGKAAAGSAFPLLSRMATMLGFQHGGLVTRPTVALVGEKGPELIVPVKPNQVTAGGLKFPDVIGTRRENDICKKLEGIEKAAEAVLTRLTEIKAGESTKIRPNIAFTLKGFAR